MRMAALYAMEAGFPRSSVLSCVDSKRTFFKIVTSHSFPAAAQFVRPSRTQEARLAGLFARSILAMKQPASPFRR
jgi:hypothetical protein